MKRTRITKRFSCVVLSIILTMSTFMGLTLTPNAIDSRIENAVQIAINIANDNSHGYNSNYNNRKGPDYDCSSLVYYAFSSAGFNLSPSWFVTSTMGNALKNAGFKEITNINLSDSSGLQRGDILWKDDHTEIYIGSNQLVGAHYHYGYTQTGDQNGKEISVTNYYYKGSDGTVWTKVYRYESGGSVVSPIISEMYISQISRDSFRVVCELKNAGTVSKVKIATWTTGDQSDLIWRDANYNGAGSFFVDVNRNDYRQNPDVYISHVYIYDLQGGLITKEINFWPDTIQPIWKSQEMCSQEIP